MVSPARPELFFDVTLQDIFRYADPLLIAVDPIRSIIKKERKANVCGPGVIFRDTKLWTTLETTLDLLAHYTLVAENSNELKSKLLESLRGILLLFGVDIAQKQKFAFLADTRVEDVNIWYSFDRMDIEESAEELVRGLSALPLSSAREELNALKKEEETNKLVCMIGSSIYKVVGTRDSGWMSAMSREYKYK